MDEGELEINWSVFLDTSMLLRRLFFLSFSITKSRLSLLRRTLVSKERMVLYNCTRYVIKGNPYSCPAVEVNVVACIMIDT